MERERSISLQQNDDPATDRECVGVATEPVDLFDVPAVGQEWSKVFFHEAMFIGKAAYQTLSNRIGVIIEVDGNELLPGVGD